MNMCDLGSGIAWAKTRRNICSHSMDMCCWFQTGLAFHRYYTCMCAHRSGMREVDCNNERMNVIFCKYKSDVVHCRLIQHM